MPASKNGIVKWDFYANQSNISMYALRTDSFNEFRYHLENRPKNSSRSNQNFFSRKKVQKQNGFWRLFQIKIQSQ